MKQAILSSLLMFLPILSYAFSGDVQINGLWYKIVTKSKTAEIIQNPDDKYSGDIIIPESVDYEETKCSVISINKEAFKDCVDLTSVYIPNSVTTICDLAFKGCTSLTSIAIPRSVKKIGYAFSGCNGLKSVHISDLEAWCKIEFDGNPLEYAHHLILNGEEIKNLEIPNTLTCINNRVFHGCSSFVSVSIPNTITQIGDYAFYGCSGLTELTIPSSVINIGMSAFQDCSGLRTIVIPNSLSIIPHACFWRCKNLKSIIIPTSVVTIKDYAFRECSNLTTVTIPSSVKYINQEAFRDCPELTDVYCYAENVPESYYEIFKGSEIEYAKLHVPDKSLYRYSQHFAWAKFGSFIGINSEPLPRCSAPLISYYDGDIIFSCNTPGVTYVPKIEFLYSNESKKDKISLSSSYVVKVYATKEGYQDSEVTTKEIMPGKFGDLNNDGFVNVADHVKLSDMIMNNNK